MKKQDLIDRIKAIGTCDDDVKRRTLLSELEDESSKDYDELERLQTDNKTLTDANETLRDANMKLFLRVGSRKDDKEIKENETGIKDDKKLSYDALFDEKGDLK